MTSASYNNLKIREIPPKFRKFNNVMKQRHEDSETLPFSLPPAKQIFSQTVLLYLPPNLLMRIPGADGPAHLVASRHIRASQPHSIDNPDEKVQSSPSSNPIPISDGNDMQPSQPKRPKTRRIPRSEMRAFYKTLSIPELEQRVETTIQQLREVVMEYIYATYKPDAPLPSLMQLRMHPPIARVAQDVDDVDQALKLARDAERAAKQPCLVQPVNKPIPKKEKKAPKDRPPPTMIPDPNNPGQFIKRGRGRPRKHPLPPVPPPPNVNGSSSEVNGVNTQN